MPDEPMSGAGDTGSSPSFRAPRADEPTEPERPRNPRPQRPREDQPGGRDREGGSTQLDEEPPTAATAPVPSRRAAAASGPDAPAVTDGGARSRRPSGGRAKGSKVRARKVRRIVRHIEPWSVLKISLLFYAALFIIISVASALLWNAARSAGTIDDVESFITEVGGFGTCEPIDGADEDTTTTTVPPTDDTQPPDQFDPTGTETTLAPGDLPTDPELDEDDGDGTDCREGERLVGEFEFEDGRIRQAFLLGGIVLVLAGSALSVILVLLFNLMSDLTGGVRVTVLEEEVGPRPPSRSGSPRPQRRD